MDDARPGGGGCRRRCSRGRSARAAGSRPAASTAATGGRWRPGRGCRSSGRRRRRRPRRRSYSSSRTSSARRRASVASSHSSSVPTALPSGLVDSVAVKSSKPNASQHREHEVEQADQLVLDLVAGAEDVAVVLGEAADAHEAVQHPRALVAVHRAQLEQPQRQLPVAALPAPEDQHVERAVHRLRVVRPVLQLHRAGTWRRRTSRGGRWSPTASTGPGWASRRTRSRRPGGAGGCSPPSACGRCRPWGARRRGRRPARRGTTAGRARRPACGGPAPGPARGARGAPPGPAWTPTPCRRCAAASGCARRPASRRRRPASA